MVVDTSALIAILSREPEAEDYRRRLDEASDRLISTATLLEASMVVLSRHGDAGLGLLRSLMTELDLQPVAFTADQAEAAVDAFRQFGKGRHPAGLNFGDCFAYALAKVMDRPLLFKGDDFARTDVVTA